jgi:hypothetical protein
MAAAKNRKVADENCVFQSNWSEEYLFVLEDVAVCLVCNGKMPCFKEYNIKRHYEINYISQQVAYKVSQGKTK